MIPQPMYGGLPVLLFAHRDDWTRWLASNHALSTGVWLQLAKKAASIASVSYAEALDAALCYGWIDGQKQRYDDASWLQKFTPRGAKSIWSKVNCGKVQVLIEGGRMQPAGLAAVERAKHDGRWDAAYDSQSRATVPADLQAALDASPEAQAFFATLSSGNRYAILFRIQTAKQAETRVRRIGEFIRMLEQHETLHP